MSDHSDLSEKSSGVSSSELLRADMVIRAGS